MSLAWIGIPQGIQEWRQESGRRRSEIVNLFDQWRKNNPYATADDFNRFVESIVGPEEYYLKGALPNQAQIEQYAAENAKRKKMDDLNNRVSSMSSTLDMQSKLSEIMGEYALWNQDDDKVVMETAKRLGVEGDQDIMNMLRGMDVKGLRNRSTQKFQDDADRRLWWWLDQLSQAGAPPPSQQEIEAKLGGSRLPPNAYNAMVDRYNDQLKTRKMQLQTDWHKIRSELVNDPLLLTMVASSNSQYASPAEVLKRIRQRAESFFIGDPDGLEREARGILEEINSGADILKEKNAMDMQRANLPLVTERLENEQKTSSAILKMMAKNHEKTNPRVAQALNWLAESYYVPQAALESLETEVIRNVDPKADVSVIVKDIATNLMKKGHTVTSASRIPEIAAQTVAKKHQVPMTAQEYISANTGPVNSEVKRVKQEIEFFDSQLIDASDAEKDELLGQKENTLMNAIIAFDGMVDDLRKDRADKMIQKGEWAPNIGSDIETTLTEQVKILRAELEQTSRARAALKAQQQAPQIQMRGPQPPRDRPWSSGSDITPLMDRLLPEYDPESGVSESSTLRGMFLKPPTGDRLNFRNEGQREGVKPELISALDSVSQAIGKPLTITSGYRSKAHNEKVGGARHSMHMTGEAVDIDMSGMSERERQMLVVGLLRHGVVRFGTYEGSNMLHVDLKGKTPYFMHNKSAHNIAQAPQWFKNVKSLVEQIS